MWFGTQYGLNRYDGYKSKVFKHEPDRPDSLSCVYVRSLLVDHAGTLWVGCDRFLDRFDPATETFKHYRIYTEISNELPTPIERIREDHQGVLWLATEKGLSRFDPTSGRTTRYSHNPDDPSSIAANRINVAAEDREGRLWVASAKAQVDQLDSGTGKVLRRAPFHREVSHFHEDEFGILGIVRRRFIVRARKLESANRCGEMSFPQLQPEGDPTPSHHFRNNRDPQRNHVVELHGRPPEVRSHSQ